MLRLLRRAGGSLPFYHEMCIRDRANYGSTRFQTGECRADYRQAGTDYEKTVKELERITGAVSYTHLDFDIGNLFV